MNVYKVLMQQNNTVETLLDDSTVWNLICGGEDYFVGKNGDIFAVKYDVEKFRLIKKEILIAFSSKYISQLIVTNYKFLMLVNYSECLNLKLVDVSYKNDLDEERERVLFKEINQLSGDDMIKNLLTNFKEDRLDFNSISFRYVKDLKQLIKINSNGTITTIGPKEDIYQFIPNVIDFLFKGPIDL